MIISTLADRQKYYSLHPKFEKAFEYFMNEGRFLEDGIYNVEGDEIILIIKHVELKSEHEVLLEAHYKYVDIQIVMDGIERYGLRDRRRCVEPNSTKVDPVDAEVFDDKYNNLFTLTTNDFVVFFPEDAHTNEIGVGRVKKAMIKVKVQ